MPAAVRIGDMEMGHGCFSPTPAITGASTVFINGIPAVRTGDMFVKHACPKPHDVNAGPGSSTVFIEGKPASRVGDMTMCGAVIGTGSFNVIIGG